jgi:hypothetical protein
MMTPFAWADAPIWEGTPVAIANSPREAAKSSYVPPITPDELTRRNRAAIALLDSWEQDGDEQEQRETMGVLRAALGEGRTLSARNLFP